MAPDNETLVARSDVLVLATRPAHAVPAATGLPWRDGQTVISVVAGLEVDALAPAVSPATLVRAMPSTCCAIGESPTVMYPEDRTTRDLFEALGHVLAVPDEARFATASVFGAYYGWVFALIADALTRQGIAVLRYDDRGVAESTGDFATATGEDLASDASAAIDYLLTAIPIVTYDRSLIFNSTSPAIVKMIKHLYYEITY